VTPLTLKWTAGVQLNDLSTNIFVADSQNVQGRGFASLCDKHDLLLIDYINSIAIFGCQF